jgi:polysaccharide biosynthesis protein PslH
MNILYITPYAPDPIRVRPYSLIRALVQRGDCVTLATVWERPDELASLERLRAEGVAVVAAPLTRSRRAWNMLRALPTSRPLQASYCDSPELRRLMRPLCLARPGGFDVVHVEHLRGAVFGLACKAHMLASPDGARTPIVWDSVDCITYLFEQAARRSQSLRSRLMTSLELGRTRKYEGWLAGAFDRVLVTSQADRRAFESLATAPAPIDVIPNGVDLDAFRPGEAPRQPNTIVFSGKMSYHANVTAALYLANEVMPLVWAQLPEARLIIAGSRPAPAVAKLGETYRGQVEITGYLPDLRIPLQRASISAAPLLYGAGIQNKVLEAMACATPVVATPRAVAALDTHPGVDCLVADAPQAFADALLRLFYDSELRARIGAAGRAYVEARHDWRAVANQLESSYREAISQVASAPR